MKYPDRLIVIADAHRQSKQGQKSKVTAGLGYVRTATTSSSLFDDGGLCRVTEFTIDPPRWLILTSGRLEPSGSVSEPSCSSSISGLIASSPEPRCRRPCHSFSGSPTLMVANWPFSTPPTQTQPYRAPMHRGPNGNEATTSRLLVAGFRANTLLSAG